MTTAQNVQAAVVDLEEEETMSATPISTSAKRFGGGGSVPARKYMLLSHFVVNGQAKRVCFCSRWV